MKQKAIIIFILSIYSFTLLSQSKRENIDLINLKSIKFEEKCSSVKLICGHSDYSFDKFLKINKDLLIIYDNNTSTFYLINLIDNTVLSQINLFKLKEITKSEPREEYFSTNFLLEYIGISDNSFFNVNYDSYPFEKLNDSTIFVGFFNFYETKFGKGTQFNLKIVNNKLQPEFTKYNISVFKDLKINKLRFLESNAFDATTLFTFNKNQYCYFIYLPVFKNDSTLTTPLYNNFVMKVVDSKKMDLVSDINKNRDLSKEYIVFNNCLLDYYPKLPDSIILRDTNFKIVNSFSINDLFAEENIKESVKEIKLYKDEKANKLFAITHGDVNKNDRLYQYKIYEVKIDNFNIKTKKTKIIYTDNGIEINQIFNNQFLFKYRNPLFNTNYIYGIDFNNECYKNTDTLLLNFTNYQNINAFKYQGLLSVYNNNKFNYEPTTKIIKKTAMGNPNANSKEYPQHSPQELALSVEKCLNLKNYDYFLGNLTAFEDNEYKTFSLLIDNNILKHDSTLYNQDFFNLLKKDIYYFTDNPEKLYFDNFKNITIFKTPTNHYYKFIKDGKEWYLCASVLIEGKGHIENERKEFQRKYNFLEYIKEKNTLIFEEKGIVLDTVKLIATIPDSLNIRLFPRIYYEPDSFPQNKPEDLINSLKKAILRNKYDYIFSQLTIYPIQEITEMVNNNNYKFDLDTTLKSKNFTQLILNKIEKNECKRKKINKNIIKYIINEENCILQVYFILLQKRWYIYSVMRAQAG